MAISMESINAAAKAGADARSKGDQQNATEHKEIPAGQQLGADPSAQQAPAPAPAAVQSAPEPAPAPAPQPAPEPAPAPVQKAPAEPQHKSKAFEGISKSAKVVSMDAWKEKKSGGNEQGMERTQQTSQKVLSLGGMGAGRSKGDENVRQQGRSSNVVSLADAAEPRKNFKAAAHEQESFKGHFARKEQNQGNVVPMPSREKHVPMEALSMAMGIKKDGGLQLAA